MSSTARGASRENNDFYPTPGWCVDLLLSAIRPSFADKVLEPAAGDGAIIKRLISYGIAPEKIAAIEIDQARAEMVRAIVPDVRCEDFFLEPDLNAYDLIITNPPFALATNFARRAVEMTRYTGTVALLLRLNWLGSQERAEFHRAHPSDILLLPKRPEFTASMSCSAKKSGCAYRETLAIEAPRPKACPTCGAKTMCSTTDSIEYAWFVWGPGRGNRWSILPMPDQQAIDAAAKKAKAS